MAILCLGFLSDTGVGAGTSLVSANILYQYETRALFCVREKRKAEADRSPCSDFDSLAIFAWGFCPTRLSGLERL
jgi:hypothetical protein